MSEQRNEIPAIVPEKDEIASHQQRIRGGRGGGGGKTPPPVSRPAGRGGLPWLALLALVVALVAVAGAGYLYQQWQVAQTQLADTEARLQVLEEKLSLSDESQDQTLTSLNVKLKEANSEIRKLWGVSYDRNRKAIAENSEALKALRGELNQLNGRLPALSEADAALKEELAALQSAVEAVKTGQQSLAELREKVASHAEAIAAIDAYRRNHNRDFLKLQQTVNQLQAPAQSAAPTP